MVVSYLLRNTNERTIVYKGSSTDAAKGVPICGLNFAFVVKPAISSTARQLLQH